MAAAAGVFFPSYLFVVVVAPYYRRFAKSMKIRAFISGVTAAAVGGIGGAAYILGKRAIIDIPTAIIALLAFLILVFTKKVPEPILILLAGGVGLVLKGI